MISKHEIAVHGFDGQLEKEFSYIYAFFMRHFNFRSVNTIVRDENAEMQFANA